MAQANARDLPIPELEAWLGLLWAWGRRSEIFPQDPERVTSKLILRTHRKTMVTEPSGISRP